MDESNLHLSFTLFHIRNSAVSTQTTMYVGGVNADNKDTGKSVTVATFEVKGVTFSECTVESLHSLCGWDSIPEGREVDRD